MKMAGNHSLAVVAADQAAENGSSNTPAFVAACRSTKSKL